MRIGPWRIKRRVVAGFAGGIVVLGIWLLWSLRTLPATGASPQRPQAYLRVTGVGQQKDRVLLEQKEFLDPTPLFSPTYRNYEQRQLPASLERQPGELFPSYGELFLFVGSQGLPVPHALPLVEAPKTPIDALKRGAQAPFAGFGLVDQVYPPLPARTAKIEVVALENGKLVLEQSIKDETIDLRREAEIPSPEFILAVAPAGLVGDIIPLTEGLPEEEVSALRDYLAKTFRLGQRLSPGTYRVTVGL